MKKKYYILVLTFLSLFVGQSSYAFGDSESGDKGQEDSYSCTDKELQEALKNVGNNLDDVVVINDHKDDIEKVFKETVIEIQDQNPGKENEDDSGGDNIKDYEPIEDPCEEAKKADLLIMNQIISNQNNTIRTNSTNKEFGAEQNLTIFPVDTSPNYLNVPVRSNGNSSSFSPNFTWNDSNGFTIGVSHGHPGNGAPSPADIVNAFGNLSNPELIAGGQSAIDYYKDNFTISVVTADAVFIVSINNWDALGIFYNAFHANSEVANNLYLSEGNKYLDEHPTISSNIANELASTFAALKIYGDSITITKIDNDSTKSSPLKLDVNGNIEKTPCP